MRVVARSIPDAHLQPGATKRIGKILRKLKITHAFVITDAGLVKARVAENIIERVQQSKIKVTLFDKVVPNPTVEIIENGAKVLRSLMVCTH